MSSNISWECPYCNVFTNLSCGRSRDSLAAEYSQQFDCFESYTCVAGHTLLMLTSDNPCSTSPGNPHSRLVDGNSRHKSKAYFYVKSFLCPNSKCQKLSIKVSCNVEGETILKEVSLLPESQAKPFPDCIPASILKDYKEACSIRDKSPNASAVLSRRCLQGMVRDFWKVTKQKNLKLEIESIKQDVKLKIWEAIDKVRRMGNIGAHMEGDVNLMVNVEPEEAGQLIWLIEFLLEEWYINRHETNKRLELIPKMPSKQEKAERNQ